MKRWSRLCQIALCVLDMEATLAFYAEVFGYRRSGGTCLFRGRIADRIQDYPNVRTDVRWMVSGDPGFQLEFFRFENPPAQPRPVHAQTTDLGWARMGLWVPDFKETVERLRRRRALFSEPAGPTGDRRVCCRDPDGTVLELQERSLSSHRPDGSEPVRAESVTLHVPDLARAVHLFSDVLGIPRSPTELHTADMERLWGMSGAERRTTTLWTGTHAIELVQYLDPGSAPGSRPLGTAGLYHVALRFPSAKATDTACSELQANGERTNGQPARFWVATVLYAHLGPALVEYLHYRDWIRCFIGFRGPSRQPPVLTPRLEA